VIILPGKRAQLIELLYGTIRILELCSTAITDDCNITGKFYSKSGCMSNLKGAQLWRSDNQGTQLDTARARTGFKMIVILVFASKKNI
jgi:hypothetical protein